MKILVPVKRVIDPNIVVRINNDASDVVLDNVPHAINPFDEVALTRAAQFKNNGEADEVVAVSIGSAKSAEILRTALAMEADRAIHIVHGEAEHLLPFDIALILRQVMEEEQPQLVLMGKQAIDNDAAQTPSLLAGMTDRPHLPDVSKISLDEDGVLVRFNLNSMDTSARAGFPCIVSCDLHLAEPRPLSLPQMMKAKKKEIVAKNLESFGIELSGGIEVETLVEPPARPPCRMFASTTELVEQLKSDGHLT